MNSADVSQTAKKSDQIYWADCLFSYDGKRANISSLVLTRYPDASHLEVDCSTLESAIDGIVNSGAKRVFVWDADMLGGFFEYYALKKNLRDIKEVECDSHGRPREECFSVMYNNGRGILNIRLTLRRTKTGFRTRGARVGQLRTVELRGLMPYFGALSETAAGEKFGTSGVGFLALFDRVYSRLCREPVMARRYLLRVYTAGGAARRLYLRMRYGKDSLREYQREHPANRDIDLYFRARKLLLPGLCTFPAANQGKLIEAKLTKYDVNGLYSYIADHCGELGPVRESDFFNFIRDRDGKYEYIIVVKGLTMFRKDGMPEVFSSPFLPNSSTGAIYIEEEFALFRELWDCLHIFYNFEEYEVVRVFRAERRKDSAITEYNSALEAIKESASANGDAAERWVSKLLLNNLYGKFAQRTAFSIIHGFYDEEVDCVAYKTEAGGCDENWEARHFDFVRGAMVYVLARVKLMRDLLDLPSPDGELINHHFYSDTDSIVTDLTLPAEMISETETGKYKIEEEIKAFGVFAKKVYYRRLKDGRDVVTAAGIERGSVVRHVSEAYGEGLPPRVFWDILKHGGRIPVCVKKRVPGGTAQIVQLFRIDEIDIEKELLL